MRRLADRMLSQVYRVLFVLLLLVFATSKVGAQEGASTAYNRLSEIFRTNQVSRVTIIHVPSDIQTRTRIGQQALRELSPVDISFLKPRERGFLDGLQEVAGEFKVAKKAPEREVRWGILFFDTKGRELIAVFLDPTGQFVQVGGDRLWVQGKTLGFIKHMVTDSLK